MDAFDMCQIVADHLESGEHCHEFFSADRLSVGLYVLKAGTTNPRISHTEAEIYYIVSGSATIVVEGEHRQIGAGAVIYVDADRVHRFYSIAEDMSVVAVFTPLRHSLRI